MMSRKKVRLSKRVRSITIQSNRRLNSRTITTPAAAAHQASTSKKTKLNETIQNSAHLLNFKPVAPDRLIPLHPPILNPSDRILLVGEGNLSFSVSLLLQHSHPGNLITASTLDSRETVSKKYPESIESIKILDDHQVRLIFELDATNLDHDKRIKNILRRDGPFDRIIFNFPHLGGSESHQDRIVRAHQTLILRFLRSSFSLLSRTNTTHDDDDDHHHHHHSLRESSIDPSHPTIRTNKRPFETKKGSRRSKKPRAEEREESPSDDDDAHQLHPNHHRPSSSSSSSSSSHSEDHAPPPRIRKPGTVLITTGTDSPYSLWDVPGLAKNGRVLAHTILYPNHPNLRSKGDQPNYRLIRSFDFDRWISSPDPRGDQHHRDRSIYRHRQTNGLKNLDKDTRPSHPRTWEFQPIDP